MGRSLDGPGRSSVDMISGPSGFNSAGSYDPTVRAWWKGKAEINDLSAQS